MIFGVARRWELLFVSFRVSLEGIADCIKWLRRGALGPLIWILAR